MKRKRFASEKIISMLREAEVSLSQAVSGKLFNGSFTGMNLIHHDPKSTIHDPVDLFRIKLFRE